MADRFTDRLSEYLDGDVTASERAAIEAHLRDCPGCARTLDDLREVAAIAGSLPARPPQADLWSGIAGRLEPRATDRVVPIGAFRTRADRAGEPAARTGTPDARRFSFTAAQLAAAAALLVATSAGVSWLVRSRMTEQPPPQVAAAPAASDAGGDRAAAIRVANFADAQYDAAVSDLQRALADGRGRLDPKTIDVLERNLAIIDQAIDQARKALAADPANTYLNAYLADARRRKLDLLREATAALANLPS